MKKGQALIESIVAVAVLALVMTAAIALIVMSTANRRNNFDRRKANELANKVVESFVDKSQNDPAVFWNYSETPQTGLTDTSFPGYVYSVDFNELTQPAYPNCGTGISNQCVELMVVVGWQGKNPQSLTVRRFFSRK